MPELPEVEVVRRGLEQHVTGRTVACAAVSNLRSVRRHPAGAADFVDRIRGRRLAGARRRGKYLWIPLQDGDLSSDDPGENGTCADEGYALLAHLGMSGQLLVRPSDAPAERHLRVRLTLRSDGGDRVDLRFVDQRTFGALAVARMSNSTADGTEVPEPVVHIAVDPLEPSFDLRTLTDRMRRRRTGVKRALLDQTLVSGVGNIYADEALWRAGMHYARPTETLRRTEVERLVAAVQDVMRAALDQGGTSFDAAYVDVNGQSGWFDRSLAVYGKEDRPCLRCGAPVRREPFMNRSSFRCPRCQPRPRRPRW